jgi:hypothetical protein
MRHATPTIPRQRRCQTIALAWLAAGAFLLVLGPLDAHDDAWGWTPLFWLLLAPLSLLAAIHPTWPLQLLARVLRAQRRVARAGHRAGALSR